MAEEQVHKGQPDFTGGECGGHLRRGILQGLGNLGNYVSNAACD